MIILKLPADDLLVPVPMSKSSSSQVALLKGSGGSVESWVLSSCSNGDEEIGIYSRKLSSVMRSSAVSSVVSAALSVFVTLLAAAAAASAANFLIPGLLFFHVGEHLLDFNNGGVVIIRGSGEYGKRTFSCVHINC